MESSEVSPLGEFEAPVENGRGRASRNSEGPDVGEWGDLGGLQASLIAPP